MIGVAPFPFLLLICYFISPNAGVRWYPLKNNTVRARVLMFSVSFFCVVSGSPDMRACRTASESVRKTAFLGFSSHEMMVSLAFNSARIQLCSLSTVSHWVLMLLMYRRKTVGEMTPLCGTPRIFTLLLKWPSSFTLADLSCRKHPIHLYILPETPLSSIFSRPSSQTLSKGFVRSKKTETTFFFS